MTPSGTLAGYVAPSTDICGTCGTLAQICGTSTVICGTPAEIYGTSTEIWSTKTGCVAHQLDM